MQMKIGHAPINFLQLPCPWYENSKQLSLTFKCCWRHYVNGVLLKPLKMTIVNFMQYEAQLRNCDYTKNRINCSPHYLSSTYVKWFRNLWVTIRKGGMRYLLLHEQSWSPMWSACHINFNITSLSHLQVHLFPKGYCQKENSLKWRLLDDSRTGWNLIFKFVTSHCSYVDWNLAERVVTPSREDNTLSWQQYNSMSEAEWKATQ